MNRLFRRTAVVTAWLETIPTDETKFNPTKLSSESIEIKDLRIQFSMRKSLKKTPNESDVTITNLSSTSRAFMERRPMLVQVDAGYDDVPRLLFTGDVRFAMTKLKGADWETLLQVGDGDCHYHWSRVNRSYGPGTSVRTMLTDAAGSLGFKLPKHLADDKTLNAQFATGRTLQGPTRDELSRLLAAYGYDWSIQNNQLVVLRDDQVNAGQAIPISEETGMLDTPEFGSPPRSGKKPHINVKMLLYPEIVPGCLIQLTSKVKNGLFRVEEVTHRGDTHGTTWETEIEISPR